MQTLNAKYQGNTCVDMREMFAVETKYGYQRFEASQALKVDELAIGCEYEIVVEGKTVIAVNVS